MVDNVLPQGAVQRALELQLFGRFTTRESTPSVATSAGVLLQNNPERIGFVIVNTAAVKVTFSLKRDLVSDIGLVLAQIGDTISANYIEDAQFPTHELSAIAEGAGGQVYIIEFIRSNL